MFHIKYTIVLAIFLTTVSCKTQKTQRELEFEATKNYQPKSLNNYGFVLPVGSKVPEVHQLANDLQADFFFYRNKEKYEQTADKIIQLDSTYATAYLMKSFYETDTLAYKRLMTKAFELSKKNDLISERSMVQADYYLLIEKNYKKAQEYFQKVVDIYPDSAIAI
ncbi:hypothetical protein NBT05_11435 [Aquimarina sp. ERC-38]|uniref:hypothetical protein n=1 Tax=Aquimarina sp. ERC-38 TaxID=2949996 RepID=UPI002248506D|nr:hypothetical protein [Aquimarina sp. ERC-38]UZO79568.1 hypothetical protein NBT05_11435 [Aquimarina sp. ERC-38]